jgi:asparagine synthase (glutamine-hydrolysing)
LPVRHKLRDLERTSRRVDENEPGKHLRSELQSGEGKTVLRAAMARTMPENATARIKQGFSAPDASWFRGESIDYVNRVLRDPRARVNELLRPEYVKEILDRHTTGKENHRLFIWSLLCLEWWLRKFMS